MTGPKITLSYEMDLGEGEFDLLKMLIERNLELASAIVSKEMSEKGLLPF